MKIQNTLTHNTPSFNGYDARKLKGFVMNSNYGSIADEMKKIGDIENFKVFLFQKKALDFQLITDKFEHSENHKGCWAQDIWGIVKNTLLAYENSPKSEILQDTFNLSTNSFQTQVHKKMNVPEIQDYIDSLYSLNFVRKDGKLMAEIPTPDGVTYVDKKIWDAEFKVNTQILKNIYEHTHIKGGNYFITRNQSGKDEVLIGKNELKKYSIDELKQIFMTDKIHILPQADFHIDLFVRPLKDKKVLIADDEKMLSTLTQGFNKIKDQIIQDTENNQKILTEAFIRLGTCISKFKQTIATNPYANMNVVEKSLTDAGYETIKVPARLFEITENMEAYTTEYLLKHKLNYLNANLNINDKNELIYITNKSNLDKELGLTPQIQEKINFSVEKAFIESVKDHVDKVYFVSGKNNAIPDLLSEWNGGIHCMSMEVPE